MKLTPSQRADLLAQFFAARIGRSDRSSPLVDDLDLANKALAIYEREVASWPDPPQVTYQESVPATPQQTREFSEKVCRTFQDSTSPAGKPHAKEDVFAGLKIAVTQMDREREIAPLSDHSYLFRLAIEHSERGLNHDASRLHGIASKLRAQAIPKPEPHPLMNVPVDSTGQVIAQTRNPEKIDFTRYPMPTGYVVASETDIANNGGKVGPNWLLFYHGNWIKTKWWQPNFSWTYLRPITP